MDGVIGQIDEMDQNLEESNNMHVSMIGKKFQKRQSIKKRSSLSYDEEEEEKLGDSNLSNLSDEDN